jgi:hypothetical protein
VLGLPQWFGDGGTYRDIGFNQGAIVAAGKSALYITTL